MLTLLPQLPLAFSPRTRIEPRLNEVEVYDARAIERANRLGRNLERIRCGGLTQSYAECFFANTADHTAVASSAVEATLLAGTNRQPVITAFTLAGPAAVSKALTFEASGVFSTTATPTLIFQARVGSTAGSADLTGTSVGVSAAITSQSGVTSKYWYLRLDLNCTAPGIGTNNCTLSGAGYVFSPTGFASPFFYPLEPTTPDTATWTSTINGGVANYFNLSMTWSASSASNTITCKMLRAFLHN